MRICPVTAMYQRHDGIVEFDRASASAASVHAGVPLPMPSTSTRRRTPRPSATTARTASTSGWSRRASWSAGHRHPFAVTWTTRIGDQPDAGDAERHRAQAGEGTAPKLFYIEGNDCGCCRTSSEARPESFLWRCLSTTATAMPVAANRSNEAWRRTGHEAGALGVAIYQGRRTSSAGGPIVISGGRMAEHMVQTSCFCKHKAPWHWPVPAYLDEGVAPALHGAGAGLPGWASRLRPADRGRRGLVALLFIAITPACSSPRQAAACFVDPLSPAVAELADTGVSACWWASRWWWGSGESSWARHAGMVARRRQPLRPLWLWGGAALAVGVAVYQDTLRPIGSRSLAGRCPLHLVVQAALCRAGMLLLSTWPARLTCRPLFVMALVVTCDAGAGARCTPRTDSPRHPFRPCRPLNFVALGLPSCTLPVAPAVATS